MNEQIRRLQRKETFCLKEDVNVMRSSILIT